MRNKNRKGRFRKMTMATLKKEKNSHFWQKIEKTSLIYGYPLPINNLELIKKGHLLAKGIPKTELKMIGPFLTAQSPKSHIGPFLNAIDFLIHDGIEVLASQNGEIIEIEESFDEWGVTPIFRNKLNFITIKHYSKTGKIEFSQYCHLDKKSISEEGLFLGSMVKKGQPIAKVKKTGWTDRDHLHFIVFRDDTKKENHFGFKSLKIQFEN